jgi:hypothetical protein
LDIGKIYQQTTIDTHSDIGFAKVYPNKTALNDKALPFFEEQKMKLLRALTNRDT